MKEKMTEEIRVMVYPSLYKSFKNACNDDYKTISEVIRDYMVQYSKQEKDNGKSKKS
ncbi:MAG: hypothetical protein ACTSSP_09855 [Candidatus Asgardarchaeia archaeon]